MKGVILDGFALSDIGFSSFSKIMDFDIYERTDDKDVISRCEGKDVVITNKVPFDRKRLESLPDLKYIGVTATGYNIIDIEAAKELGIAVTNIPAYSTDAVAQHVFAFILSISNKVDLHNRSVKEGDWEKCSVFCYWKEPLFELKGKTIGIIGLGNIGKRVAELSLAFGMRVVAYSPRSRMDNVESLSLDEVLSSSDIITLHSPLTEETKSLINQESLKRVKRGAILINASRGPLVDESAVIDALDSGILSYYAADVLSVEPPRGNALSMHEKSLITPHIAWAPLETRARLLSIAEENLRSFIRGEKSNRVDR